MRNNEHAIVQRQPTAINCLESREDFLDKVACDYKIILNHFCLECVIGLLRVIIGDLNIVTHACIVRKK